ncbi:MAG TPA: GGDEF domain-containing protein [Spirochaetota bacterium]|nr:GGDEF domain-containing protein [Spirochaetota bacterium]HPJ35658.1 GGDEF domain-containing protein [Spirochaetota bacterium]
MDGNILKNIAIFEGQDEEDLDLIAKEMKRYEFSAGDILFQEGDPGDEMFVVIKGAVSIFIKDQTGEEVMLAEIREGSYFGEMSIIDQTSRSATCRTLEDTVLLALHADDFTRITSTMPESASKMMNRMLSIIVERLMKTGAFVTQMVQYGEESRKRAITDPATGLFNRRYLEESFDGLVTKAKTEGSYLSFVMFDMDRFGSLNTKYGQEFCDRLIVESADVFREVFSQDDILVRYGGDEFIFLFPGADAKAAQEKCNALCCAIREMRFAEHEELRLSCSMGFATLPEHASTMDELKDRSDKALYQAKEAGRDRALGWAGDTI